MDKFKGETAYALLCPHCDENVLCQENRGGEIGVCIYPTYEEAVAGRRSIMEGIEDESLKEPEIRMVKIQPIVYTSLSKKKVDNKSV